MKVVLVQAPFCIRHFPPLALALLAACVEREGHSAEIFDLNNRAFQEVPDWRPSWEGERTMWADPASLARVEKSPLWVRSLEGILAANPDVVSFSVQILSRHMSLWLARQVKRRRPSVRIVFGGPDCFLDWDAEYYAAQDVIDAVVTGLGEVTFPALLKAWSAERPLDAVPGLMFRRQGRIVATGEAPALPSLDNLPFNDFSAFRLEEYAHPDTLCISGARGCVRRCSFCMEWKITKYASMTGRRLRDEMAHQISRHPGVRKFWFGDSLINGSVHDLDGLCDAMLAPDSPLPPDVGWHGNAIFDATLTLERLVRMRKAGCFKLYFGLESASPAVLALMQKGFRIELAERILRDCKSAGINVALYIIVGFPTETDAGFQQTCDFLARNADALHTVLLSIFRVFDKSAIVKNPERFNVAPDSPRTVFWTSRDRRNTLEVRLERYRQLASLLESRGVYVHHDHVYPMLRGFRFNAAVEPVGL